jgi:hypothetical protein
MKMKFKICVILIFVLAGLNTAYSQSINIQSDNLEWTINGLTDVNANITVPYSCKFTTFGTQNIDWVQDNGNYVIHFTVVSTEGQWTDPEALGSITYSVTGDGMTGSLTISNSGTGKSASLQLTGGTNEINHIYPIQSYEKI